MFLQPNDFYNILMEAMNLAKEYVIRNERRETALVDNETAKNEFQLLVHKCFWNFSQVYNYAFNNIRHFKSIYFSYQRYWNKWV